MVPTTAPTAGFLLHALRARELTARELVGSCLERIAASPHNAVIALRADDAFEEADEVDRLRATRPEAVPPLAGLPITVKDALHVAGMRTVCGMRERADAAPEPQDAPAIRRLRSAGAIVVGKTNVARATGDWQTENPVFGATLHPSDAAVTPGGSGGGGAVAVATDLSPLDIGSDIAGSLRIPAAFCGVYAHRPTDSLVSTAGHVPGPPCGETTPLQSVGPLARTADDLKLALRYMRLPRRPGGTRDDHGDGLRVAVAPEHAWLPLDPRVREAVEDVANRLPDLNVHVDEAAPPEYDDGMAFHELYCALLSELAAHGVDEAERERRAAERGTAPDAFDRAALAGLHASPADHDRWLRERSRWQARFARFFADWDAWLTPVTFTPAFAQDEAPTSTPQTQRRLYVGSVAVPYRRLAVYPALASLVGLPATVIPAGMRTGVQLVGGAFDDETLLDIAARLAAGTGAAP